MQAYGTTMPSQYPAYMFSQPSQNGHAYPAPPPPLGPHRSQSSRYDPPLPPNAFSSYSRDVAHAQAISDNGRAPRPRHLKERSSTDPTKKPLKSAMRKPSGSGAVTPAAAPKMTLQRSRTVPANALDSDVYRGREMKPSASQLSRGRSVSGSERPMRATSLSRQRSRSQARRNFTPGHLILSLSGTCRMNLSSVIYQETVDNIRERVLTMWPDGCIFQTYRDESNEFLVQFSGNPWTAKGSLGSMAMKLILELFAVLARQGYICISAIDTGHTVSAPRLVFKVDQPEPVAEFAMIVFSNSRRKIRLINHTHQFCESLTGLLHDAFPRRMRNASWDDNDMYGIEMSKLDFDSIADLMIATILEHASASYLKLEGTIPLSHSGFWGFIQGRKELWIFRRTQGFHHL